MSHYNLASELDVLEIMAGQCLTEENEPTKIIKSKMGLVKEILEKLKYGSFSVVAAELERSQESLFQLRCIINPK